MKEKWIVSVPEDKTMLTQALLVQAKRFVILKKVLLDNYTQQIKVKKNVYKRYLHLFVFNYIYKCKYNAFNSAFYVF